MALRCVKNSEDCNKILEILIIEDPNHILKFGYSGRYSICKHHADIQISAFRYKKKIEIDENKELTFEEKRELNFESKSLCSKCGINLKGQSKWYFGFISESNSHRFATSACSSCAKITLLYLGIVFNVHVGSNTLDATL